MRECRNPVGAVLSRAVSLALAKTRGRRGFAPRRQKQANLYLYESICAVYGYVSIGEGENSSVVTVIRGHKFTTGYEGVGGRGGGEREEGRLG